MKLRNRLFGIFLALWLAGVQCPAGGVGQTSAVCVFDNFVWFKEQEIITEIRKDLPSFDGTAPDDGESIPKILKALERLLKTKNLPSEVGYTYADASALQPHPEHVFSANIARVKVCKTVIVNPGTALETELQVSLKTLITRPYSRIATRTLIQTATMPIYRKYGHLRATPRSLEAELDPTCQNGVVVKVVVDPGVAYVWGGAAWTGNKVIARETLDQALAMKPGDPANGVKLDAGLAAVAKLYGKQGYAGLQLQPTPVFDDATRALGLKIAVNEGPQYKMGNLNVVGLSENSAKMFKDLWRIKPGQVYDSTYLGEFLKRLVEVGGVPPEQVNRILTQATPDQQKQLVNVTIDFNPRS